MSCYAGIDHSKQPGAELLGPNHGLRFRHKNHQLKVLSTIKNPYPNMLLDIYKLDSIYIYIYIYICIYMYLVGGFNRSEKYESQLG